MQTNSSGVACVGGLENFRFKARFKRRILHVQNQILILVDSN